MMFAILTRPEFIASAISFSVILLLGTLGELLTERAGHLNLGVEGMMLLGGSFGYFAAVQTASLPIALLASCLGSGMGALMYAFLTVSLRVNQNVTGLALTMFGAGLANSVGSKVAGTSTPKEIEVLFDYKPFQLVDPQDGFLRFVNKAFLSHDLFVYASILLAVLMVFFLFKTREGLALRLTGENTAAADASGIKVSRIKYLYIILGGMLCGLGGLYLPLVQQGSWTDSITAGQGWLVVALVIFVRWHPIKAILGAFVFGALSILGYSVQLAPALSSLPIFNQYIMSMFPFLLTIIVLVISSARKRAWRGPAEIGNAYFREDR
ncbi:MAG: ABC transporter permease [Clostridiales bacterium]|nr:ABC transporter permease [Clostridiales bacterium]